MNTLVEGGPAKSADLSRSLISNTRNSAVYVIISQVLTDAVTAFALSNPLHPDIWPSVMKFEAETVAMTAEMLGGDPRDSQGVCGCITSGGTESILLSVKTHQEWARAERGVEHAEIVVPATAHAAFWKAGDILKVRSRRPGMMLGHRRRIYDKR